MLSIKARHNGTQSRERAGKWQESSIDTILATERERKSGRTPLVTRGREEGMPVIPGNLSTVYSRFRAPERPGGICQKRTETGRMYRRFCRWRDKGIRERILEALVDDTDFEWLMIDASHIKVHPDAAGARGGNQAMDRTKGGLTPRYIWPWMRMVCRCDSLSLLVPQRIAQLQRG